MRAFVDTSALFAILDEDEIHHEEAASTMRALLERGEPITTNYVHLEAAQLVRRRLGIKALRVLLDRLLPALRTIWVDEDTHNAALHAWRASGKKVSLVDHVSFVVMRRLGIEAAFAFDSDFDAQGFVRGEPSRSRPSHRLSDGPSAYGQNSLADLVSVSEIAERSGRSVNTIQSWRRRNHSFPKPATVLAAGPVWHWTDVRDWIGRHGQPRRGLGSLKGKVTDADDWDSPEVNAEIAALFEA